MNVQLLAFRPTQVAELALLDEQAADAHKKAAADNRTLNVAADMVAVVYR